MKELGWLALKAFLACLVLTPIFRDIFRSYGIVDQPDRRRKIHAHPIPRVGGIPIFISYAIALYPFGHQATAPIFFSGPAQDRSGPGRRHQREPRIVELVDGIAAELADGLKREVHAVDVALTNEPAVGVARQRPLGA